MLYKDSNDNECLKFLWCNLDKKVIDCDEDYRKQYKKWECMEWKTQAHNIRTKLSMKVEDKKFIMYSSDLLRAKQTSEIIGKYFGITPIVK